jgi:hypothetical protein
MKPMKLIQRIILTTLVLVTAMSSNAFAENDAESEMFAGYSCHVFSQNPIYRSTFRWDGSLPFQTQIKAGGVDGFLRVQSIGLSGRPELLFEIRIGTRTLFSTSQKSDLTDYTLIWKAAKATDEPSEITIACSASGIP